MGKLIWDFFRNGGSIAFNKCNLNWGPTPSENLRINKNFFKTKISFIHRIGFCFPTFFVYQLLIVLLSISYMLYCAQNFIVCFFVFSFSDVQQTRDELRVQVLLDEVQRDGEVLRFNFRYLFAHLHHALHALQQPQRHLQRRRGEWNALLRLAAWRHAEGDFINILQAAFALIFLSQKITKPNCN